MQKHSSSVSDRLRPVRGVSRVAGECRPGTASVDAATGSRSCDGGRRAVCHDLTGRGGLERTAAELAAADGSCARAALIGACACIVYFLLLATGILPALVAAVVEAFR